MVVINKAKPRHAGVIGGWFRRFDEQPIKEGLMEIGAKVEWTHFSRKGTAIKMTQRYGVVTRIDGNVAIVKRKGGQFLRLSVAELHVTGSGPNQLTMFAENLINAYAK